MKNFANFLVVLGVCVASLGASGFHKPSQGDAVREDNALTLFAFGTASLAVGGYITMQQRRESSGTQAGTAGLRGILAELEAIHRIVDEIARNGKSMGNDVVRDRIGALLAAEYFDLTSKSDALALQLGFADYARVWDGVAVSERLLARAWSMYTDGYPDQAEEEIPLACAAIENSVQAMRSLQ